MERHDWGVVQGKPVERFILGQAGKIQMGITNYGAAITSLWAPDRQGNLGDVVLGYDSLQAYKECTRSLGVIVGRHANRIEGASFSLNGRTYQLAANNGPNHIHGGPRGFGKAIWRPTVVKGRDGDALQLSYFSPHGEEGYPGNLQVRVTYDLTQEGDLWIDYWAQTDQDTVVNLTNHAYFNLAGYGLILDHKLQLFADFYTPINEQSLPIGEIRMVENTPLDFRTLTPIGAMIDTDHEQLRFGQGYDHNWVIREEKQGLNQAARVEHQASGRVLEVFTTKPGIQFYSGNFLDGIQGKGGISYPKRSGFCLETQYFPNSLRYSHFPSAILQAGEIYAHSTMYRFSVLD
ncbi:MAG: galactose mutarotase [Firmicutes bacterium]|nr:galactose mutarotase [Bacillota bacterium]